jgi:DNA-binding transcriptional ArsR family regulator
MNKAASEVAGVVSAGSRSLEAAVGFGLSHRLRIEILAELHDRPATSSHIAKRLGVHRERLRYHLEELLKDGSIEVADEQSAGNMTAKVFRVTKLAFNSNADWLALSLSDRQEECAVILQATWAEALASLWAGKFHSDPLVVNMWTPILLDAEAREDLAAVQALSWSRIEAIEAEATARRVASGDLGSRCVVATFGYERGRSVAPECQPLEAGIVESPSPTDSAVPTAPSGRSIEEAVTKSISHRIRIEILAALHEAPATASELVRMVGQPLPLLSHHVRQLVKDGSILPTETRYVRNLAQPVYSVVKLPLYESDEWERLSPEERQVISAITLRAAMAESLTSLWAGKLHSDPLLMLAWKPMVLDLKARGDLTKEQERLWSQICQIEGEAADRLKRNRDDGKLHVVTMLAFERKRDRPSHSTTSDESPKGSKRLPW